MSALNPNTFLRILKGSPLPTLLSLWQGGAMGRQEIMSSTGLGKSAIDSALPFLVNMGLVERVNYREWAITDEGKTAVSDYFNHYESLIIGLSNSQQPVDNSDESPKNGTSEEFDTNRESLEIGLSEIEVESYPQAESPKNGTSAVKQGAESPIIGTSPLESPKNGTSDALVSSSSYIQDNNNQTTTTTSPAPDPEIVKACHDVGIFGDVRFELSTDPFVIERGGEYVRLHCEDVNVNLAIWRMRQHWEAPAPKRTLQNQIPDEYKDLVKR